MVALDVSKRQLSVGSTVRCQVSVKGCCVPQAGLKSRHRQPPCGLDLIRLGAHALVMLACIICGAVLSILLGANSKPAQCMGLAART